MNEARFNGNFRVGHKVQDLLAGSATDWLVRDVELEGRGEHTRAAIARRIAARVGNGSKN